MKIIHLDEFEIPRSDFEKLPPYVRASLATLAYAVDEINVFKRLVVQANTNPPEDLTLRLQHVTQLNSLTRVMSAKIFEAVAVYEDSSKKAKRASDEELSKFFNQQHKGWKELKKSRYYVLAKLIRDKATNHYLVSETEQNLEFLGEQYLATFYLSKINGNSFHPMGEEIAFIGRLSRAYKEEFDSEFNPSELYNWIEWCMSASKWMTSFFQNYVLWIHKNRFPEWRLRPRKPYLEEELFFEIGEKPLPIFFSVEKYKQKNL